MPVRTNVFFSLLAVVLSQLSPLTACDYTVRDIGFVKLGEPDYSLYVLGPEVAVFSDGDTRALGDWNIRLLATSTEQHVAYPDAIRNDAHFQTNGWSMWLVDSAQRALHLESASSWEELPSIEQAIALHLNTKRMRELGDEALSSFAQIVLFDCASASKLEIAKETAASLTRLEPLLPRPILLPSRTMVISEGERDAERVLLWALGIDDASAAEAVMAVVYGCGRLAGPALSGDSIRLEETIGQLALVGESCECETDRSWYNQRRLPVFWNRDRELQAAQTLGFDPSNSRIRAEIQQILSRGSRGSSPFPVVDQIDRLVDGYFESNVVGREPRLLPIPTGRKAPEISSQVIAGDGWSFDTASDEMPDHAIAPSTPPEVTPSAEANRPGDGESQAVWISFLVVGLTTFVAVILGLKFLRNISAQ